MYPSEIKLLAVSTFAAKRALIYLSSAEGAKIRRIALTNLVIPSSGKLASTLRSLLYLLCTKVMTNSPSCSSDKCKASIPKSPPPSVKHSKAVSSSKSNTVQIQRCVKAKDLSLSSSLMFSSFAALSFILSLTELSL